MKIENLSKELDTETMSAVRGGLAETGQVVPTNVQSNKLAQIFNIDSHGPVAIANDADQSKRLIAAQLRACRVALSDSLFAQYR
jgi:hypothetical protein